MTQIISTPGDDKCDAFGANSQYQFGYFETVNATYRPKQEDALAWHVLTKKHLTPLGAVNPLTPTELGHRLWSAYKALDVPNPELQNCGCTATTTLYDGADSLITATLADASSFVVAYDQAGAPIGVIRLNQRVHTPLDASENQRISDAGGTVIGGRIRNQLGGLAVSRAIGDFTFKKTGVCSDSDIYIISLAQITEKLGQEPTAIGSFQVISVCDGYTDGAGPNATTAKQELYVLRTLQIHHQNGQSMQEVAIAKALATQALCSGSKDNVSVAVQTIQIGRPVLMGVYDGHGGPEMASYVAENIGRTFISQCQLTTALYQTNDFSVDKNRVQYERDNTDTPTPVQSSSTTTTPKTRGIKRNNAMTPQSTGRDQAFFSPAEVPDATVKRIRGEDTSPTTGTDQSNNTSK